MNIVNANELVSRNYILQVVWGEIYLQFNDL